jgi:lysophospholipase L1-like esterase
VDREGRGHWVAAWAASPTDSITPIDATGGPVPVVDDQTLRMVITPHLDGSSLRIHLSNRFGVQPVRFDQVTIGIQSRGASVRHIKKVRFNHQSAVTIAVGRDAVSDPVALQFKAFTPLVVSMYAPTTNGPPTKHWNANATSYYSLPGSGNLTRTRSGKGFPLTTQAWFYVDGLDVRAAPAERSIVAFGDSITDGFVASNPASIPATASVSNRNGRYPDDLQRRLDRARIPISVVDAGIGSNRLLTGSEPLFPGPSGLKRLRQDALDQAGVRGVLLQEGINDLGIPPTATAAEVIAGYKKAISETHHAGKRIWLGTLLPASNALFDGASAGPEGEQNREEINTWIRHQNMADGIVDFAKALADPTNHTVLRPAYGGPDHLHPNLVGYRAMARAVDLRMLALGTRHRRR